MNDPNYSQANVSPPNSSMAMVSLVSGIIGWVFFPIVAAIIAIVTGHMARSEIKNSNGTIGGDGLALAGLILGYSNLVLFCIFFLIFGAVMGVAGCAAISEAARLMVQDGVALTP